MKRKNIVGISLVVTLMMVVSTFAVGSTNPNNGKCNALTTDMPLIEVNKTVWDGAAWVDSINVDINDTVRFNVTITYYEANDSHTSTHAEDIRIVDTLPDYLEYANNAVPAESSVSGNIIYWNLTDVLADNESISIEFDAKAINYGININNATVTALENVTGMPLEGSDEATVIVEDPTSGNMVCEKLVWDSDTSSWVNEITVDAGDTVRFKITVSYSGDYSLIDIRVMDILPASLEYADNAVPAESSVSGNIIYWNLTDVLIDGESTSIEFDVVAGPEFIAPDWVNVNLANTTAHECGVGPLYCEDTATVNIGQPSKMCEKLVKDPDTGQWVDEINADVGDTVRFKITISYSGNYSLYNIRVKDTLPAGLQYADNAYPTENGVSGKNIYWNLTDILMDGESTSIEFDALVLSGGVNVNFMTVTANECNGDVHQCSDEATVIVDEVPKICEKRVWDSSTCKWVDEITANVGDTVRFKITITYWGSYMLYNIRVKDILPSCLEYADNAYPAESGVSGKNIYWNLSNNLYNGQSTSIEFDALVVADGINVNLAQVTANECSGETWHCCDTATVIVEDTCKICEKLVKDPDTGQWVDEINADVGDTVRFKIIVSYWGDVTLKLYNIRVKDTLPSCLEYADNALPPESGVSGKNIYWNLSVDLWYSQSTSIEFDALVVSEGVNVNFVNVVANECSGDVVHCSDTAIVNVGDDPDDLTADAGGPYYGVLNLPVQFTGSVSGGVSPYAYTWNFDDGHTSFSRNPSHIYTEIGEFTVTFTVVDYESTEDSDTATVIIIEDDSPPIVEISKPLRNSLYIGNNMFSQFFRTTVIVGPIDIEVDVYDTDSGIDYVKFYIDGAIKDTSSGPTYSWTWIERSFRRHYIKVVAFDNAGNSAFDEMMVWKLF